MTIRQKMSKGTEDSKKKNSTNLYPNGAKILDIYVQKYEL